MSPAREEALIFRPQWTVPYLSDPEDVARLYPGGAFRRNRKAKVGMGGMIFEKMADTERYFPQSSKADGG